MAYYDLYDSNDNLIASDVWIDDGGGGGRPIVINWYKVLLIVMLVIGVCTTFIAPVMLFLNRDVFIGNGWLHLVLPNLVMGIPVLISAALMLVSMKKSSLDDPAMNAATRLYNEKFGIQNANQTVTEYEDTDDMSDDEYVSTVKDTNKKEAYITAIYLSIKFSKILKMLSLMSFLIYPAVLISYIFEIAYGATESYVIFIGDVNILAFVFGGLSVYRNFLVYNKKNRKTAIGRVIRSGLVSLFLGTAVNVIVYAITGIGGYSILVVSLAFMHTIMMIDARFGNTTDSKCKIHVIAILAVIITVGLTALIVACAISLISVPVYEAILAYDEGRSTDLSLPITVWSICGAIGVIFATVGSILVNKILNKSGK